MLRSLLLAALFGAGLSWGVSTSRAQDKPSAPAQPAAPTANLESLQERINRLERDILELRTRTGKVPADKQDQRVVLLLETPQLAALNYYSNTQPRMFLTKLAIVNLTNDKVTIKRDDVALSLDGQILPMKEPSPQFRSQSVEINHQSQQIQTLQMKKDITVAAGGSASTWVLFADLPPGNHIPQLVLKVKLPAGVRDIDVNAQQREALGLKVERIGPRGSLGLVTISGELNSISCGALIEELDRLSSDKIARVVIRFDEGAAPLHSMLLNWLQQSASNVRNPGMESPFPTLPVTIRELHLANLPGDQFQSVGTQNGRVHKTDAEAVMAALNSAYEVLPRDELFQAIQNGTRLERAAALAGGGGRLGADKLPVVLKAADDNDAVIQNAALTALAHFGEKEAIEKLISYARKNVATLSETAIGSLAGSRYAAAHDALLEVLKNEPPESKKNIVRVLAKYPRPVWSEAIYQFLTDTRAGLNVEALNALVQVGHPKLVQVLKDALYGKDEGLKTQAFTVLSTRTDTESEEISLKYSLDLLQKEPPTDQILNLLQRVKDKRALPLLTGAFDKTQNKQHLIQTLALIGDAETAKFLVEKYPNLQSFEKGEILKALSKLDVKKFREMAAQALLSTDSQIISNTVQGLQEDGGPEAVALLIEALDKSGSSYTWSYVTNALSVAGTPAARAALIKARDGNNKEKRSYAINAITNMRSRSPGYQYVYQAQQLSQMKKHKEAIAQYDMAIQADPDLSEAYSGRATSLLHTEKFTEAGKDYQKALDLDAWNANALTGLCIVWAHDGKHAEAIKKLMAEKDKFDDNALFAYNAACVYGRAVEYLKKDTKAENRDKLLEEYTKQGLDQLRTSMQKGFQDVKWMKEDPDLKEFHKNPEFEKIAQQPVKPNDSEEEEKPEAEVEGQAMDEVGPLDAPVDVFAKPE